MKGFNLPSFKILVITDFIVWINDGTNILFINKLKSLFYIFGFVVSRKSV
jgi:hypothetical protein